MAQSNSPNACVLSPAPFVPASLCSVPHALDMRFNAGKQFFRFGDGFFLGGCYGARSFRIRPADGVIALRALFNIDFVVAHSLKKYTRKNLRQGGHATKSATLYILTIG